MPTPSDNTGWWLKFLLKFCLQQFQHENWHPLEIFVEKTHKTLGQTCQVWAEECSWQLQLTFASTAHIVVITSSCQEKCCKNYLGVRGNFLTKINMISSDKQSTALPCLQYLTVFRNILFHILRFLSSVFCQETVSIKMRLPTIKLASNTILKYDTSIHVLQLFTYVHCTQQSTRGLHTKLN